MNALLQVSDEVAAALADHRPVVALESSLIAHGPAYPVNIEIATAIEKAVRDAGAVPATIGLADGRFVIGLEDQGIARFGEERGIPKVSARDIGRVLAGGGLGATTVASTIVAAELAGIPVFSTAGIGGVHRGAQQSFDISGDLLQFTRIRVAVVCAGAKSILDLRLTAEYLETAGVPVLGYECDELPAFYSRSSGIPVPRIDDLTTAARAIQLHWQVHGSGSVLLTTPIEREHELDGAEIERAIETAMAQADADGITGNAVSPFLMKAVAAATNGRTAQATGAVLISTAVVAGQLAVAMGGLRGEDNR